MPRFFLLFFPHVPHALTVALVVMSLAEAAYLSVERLSRALLDAGETQAIMRVRALPARDSRSSHVWSTSRFTIFFRYFFFDIFNTKFYLRQNFYKDVKKHVGLKQLIQVLYNP
jgi:hypothetical protein